MLLFGRITYELMASYWPTRIVGDERVELRIAGLPVRPREVAVRTGEVTVQRDAFERGVPPRRINEIVHGTRRITADTALRLSRYFGTTERFWLNLQARFDLEEQKDVLGNRLNKEVTVLAEAS